MFTEENTNVIFSSRQIQFFLKCVALQQSVELVLRDVRLVSTGELERLIDEKKAQSTVLDLSLQNNARMARKGMN